MTAPSEGTAVTGELRRLERAWHDGSCRALAKAVLLCRQCNCPLPDWTVHAVLALITTRGKQFRSGNQTHEEWERQNAIHYVRWDMVRELRDRKEDLAYIIDPTWDSAFEQVSKHLQGKAEAGSPDAIKKSYQFVEQIFRSGKGGRFLLLD
jgi:hypothetical protein